MPDNTSGLVAVHATREYYAGKIAALETRIEDLEYQRGTAYAQGREDAARAVMATEIRRCIHWLADHSDSWTCVPIDVAARQAREENGATLQTLQKFVEAEPDDERSAEAEASVCAVEGHYHFTITTGGARTYSPCVTCGAARGVGDLTIEEIIKGYVDWATAGDTWDVKEEVLADCHTALAAHDAEVLNEASGRVRTWLRNPGGRCGLDEIQHVIHDVIQATPYGVDEVAAAREEEQ